MVNAYVDTMATYVTVNSRDLLWKVTNTNLQIGIDTAPARLGSARVRSLVALVARLEGLAGGSAPVESRARLGLAPRPDDHTGRSWAAFFGEPWDSAGEFGP